MPRFFFNIRSGDDYVTDDQGEECPTLEAAATLAVEGARELLPDLHVTRRRPEMTSFEITDETGGLKLRIRFDLAFKLPPIRLQSETRL